MRRPRLSGLSLPVAAVIGLLGVPLSVQAQGALIERSSFAVGAHRVTYFVAASNVTMNEDGTFSQDVFARLVADGGRHEGTWRGRFTAHEAPALAMGPPLAVLGAAGATDPVKSGYRFDMVADDSVQDPGDPGPDGWFIDEDAVRPTLGTFTLKLVEDDSDDHRPPRRRLKRLKALLIEKGTLELELGSRDVRPAVFDYVPRRDATEGPAIAVLAPRAALVDGVAILFYCIPTPENNYCNPVPNTISGALNNRVLFTLDRSDLAPGTRVDCLVHFPDGTIATGFVVVPASIGE